MNSEIEELKLLISKPIEQLSMRGNIRLIELRKKYPEIIGISIKSEVIQQR